jgi:hypothetical protein
VPQRIYDSKTVRPHRLFPQAKPISRTPFDRNLALGGKSLAEIKPLLFK